MGNCPPLQDYIKTERMNYEESVQLMCGAVDYHRKKRIIICGYPKSGNTWLTRLTAEILRSPVVGFWCEPFNREEAIEGLDRESKFQCFKAHHTFEQMAHTLKIYGNGTEKILYIYRDPRSVAVSASHYFTFRPKFRRLYNLLQLYPNGFNIYNKLLQSHSHKLDLMCKILVEGKNDGSWLAESWKRHIVGYKNKDNVLALSYEYLRTDTLSAASQIVDFLSISRTRNELEGAIEAQSFSRKKKQFQSEGNAGKANFLRKGKIDSWRDELSSDNLGYLEQKIGGFMKELGYTLSSDVE